MEALLSNELTGVQVLFNAKGFPAFYLMGERILDQFGFTASHMPLDVGLLVGAGALFIIMAGFLLSIFVHEKR